MAKLTDKQAQLFLDPNFDVVATVREDGSPQTSVVWVDRVIVRVRPERVFAREVD